MTADRVTVIGAGVVGACCALTLRRAGYPVTLFDPEPPGTGTSFGNAASLSTGSVVPMALPGMWREVPGWLADPLGPLTVRWRHLPRATPWLLGWLRASRPDRVERISDALARTTKPTVVLYRALLGPEHAATLIRQAGQLTVSRKPAGAGDALVQRLRDRQGIETQSLGEDEIRQLEPALSHDYKRGIFIPDAGHTTSPLRLTETLVELFLAEGGSVERAKVDGFETSDGRLAGLRAGGSVHDAEVAIVAAGIHSRALARQLGDRVPLESERGYHLEVESDSVQISRPIGDLDYKYFVSPVNGRLRFAGTVEIGGVDAPPNYERARLMGRLGRRQFPALEEGADGPDGQVWMGHRPSTPDSLPVISPASKITGAYYAFGHGHIGLTAAPATAEMVLTLLRGGAAAADLAPFGVGRF